MDRSHRPVDKERSFVPAGQSTQMIIGATPESDYQILNLSSALYQKFSLKRVFFSAYLPVNNDKRLPAGEWRCAQSRTPSVSSRLAHAVLSFRCERDHQNEEAPFLDLKGSTPKRIGHWTGLDFFPVEVNEAPAQAFCASPASVFEGRNSTMNARKTHVLREDEIAQARHRLQARSFLHHVPGEVPGRHHSVRAAIVAHSTCRTDRRRTPWKTCCKSCHWADEPLRYGTHPKTCRTPNIMRDKTRWLAVRKHFVRTDQSHSPRAPILAWRALDAASYSERPYHGSHTRQRRDYLYDGSVRGPLLTASVLPTSANKETLPLGICPSERYQPRIGQTTRQIETDFSLALRVQKGVSKRAGYNVANIIKTAALADDPHTGIWVYRCIRYCMDPQNAHFFQQNKKGERNVCQQRFTGAGLRTCFVERRGGACCSRSRGRAGFEV